MISPRRGTAAFAPGASADTSAYGNVVLSRLPISQTHQCNLSCDKREPRGCMRVDVDVHGQALHVFNVHLGTAVSERRMQAPRLAEFVADRDVPGPKVLLGDFNEWIKGLTSKTLGEMLEGVDLTHHLRRRRTYPGMLPMFHLDHIYVAGGLVVEKVSLPRNRLTLVGAWPRSQRCAPRRSVTRNADTRPSSWNPKCR